MSLVLRVFRSIYVPTSLYLLFPCRVVAESLVAGAGGRAGRVLRLFHVLLPAPAALRAEMCSYLRAVHAGAASSSDALTSSAFVAALAKLLPAPVHSGDVLSSLAADSGSS